MYIYRYICIYIYIPICGGMSSVHVRRFVGAYVWWQTRSRSHSPNRPPDSLLKWAWGKIYHHSLTEGRKSLAKYLAISGRHWICRGDTLVWMYWSCNLDHLATYIRAVINIYIYFLFVRLHYGHKICLYYIYMYIYEEKICIRIYVYMYICIYIYIYIYIKNNKTPTCRISRSTKSRSTKA